MINIFKITLTGLRRALEAAQGLGIEADSISVARRAK
jgi:hypothetical protein